MVRVGEAARVKLLEVGSEMREALGVEELRRWESEKRSCHYKDEPLTLRIT